jgi:hypothetical protein
VLAVTVTLPVDPGFSRLEGSAMAGSELERELRLQVLRARHHIRAAWENGDEAAWDAYDCRLRDLIALANRFGVRTAES